MARKVFISVLGTSFYGACKYVKGKFVSSETRFIQQATLEYLEVKSRWTSQDENGDALDRILILLTEGAKVTNWSKNKTTRFNFKTEKEEPYIGLEQILDNMNLPCPVETRDIPDGKNEDEMWSIFNTVYEYLEPDDELYFDLTHSFRYLPMLVLVLGNYAKFLKGVKVKHISYGNYEARNEDTNEAPLMDILPLTMLQDWTFAAADLIQNGNIRKFKELREANALTPFMRTRGKKNDDRISLEGQLDGYINSLEQFLLDMKLCFAPNIINGSTINRVNYNFEQGKEIFNNVVAPIPPIINKILESLEKFEKTDEDDPDRLSLLNGYEAAKWCYDHQLYQQALTILDENITTHFCRYLGTDEYVYEQRTDSNALLRHGEYKEEDWKPKKEKEDNSDWEKIKKMVEEAASTDSVKDFISQMSEDARWIHNKRNSYNHASMTRNEQDQFRKSDVEELERRINEIRRIVRGLL